MKNIKILKISLLFLNIAWLSVFFFPDFFWFFWKIWWYLLCFILIIRPLNDLLPNKNLNFLVNSRKELWILCWTFVIAHTIWYFLYFKINPIDILNKNALSINWYLFWGFLWFLFMIPPFITSNKFSILLFKKVWKTIQRFTYLFFIAWAIHIIIVKPENKIEISIFTIILIILLLVSYFKKYGNKK